MDILLLQNSNFPYGVTARLGSNYQNVRELTFGTYTDLQVTTRSFLSACLVLPY